MSSANLVAAVAALLLTGTLAAQCEFIEQEDDMSQGFALVQLDKQLTKDKKQVTRESMLSMAYVPFNFGHSVAAKAVPVGIKWGDCGSREPLSDCLGWEKSSMTGCSLMYTPVKYWPKAKAEQHFGNKTVFGIIRDPYERMVAQFRGTYRLANPDLDATCDVNTGVKRMMREYIESIKSGNPWDNDCKYLPQAEFFDGPYGASLAIDSRRFPATMNEVLTQYGDGDLSLETEEVDHIAGCDEKWAADLDEEARALVRQVYKRDFELLCEKFGYCDTAENVCITTVPKMCPEHLYKWSDQRKEYELI